MRIVLDAMGGDLAPRVVISAAISAGKTHPDWEFVLVGTDEALSQIGDMPVNVSFVQCGSFMAMDEDVRHLTSKRDSSIWVATEMVKAGDADAVISAGSTAAQMAAATLLLGRLPGVKRPAIGMVLPTLEGQRLLLDVGANSDCTPEILLQFAEMGDAFARLLLKIELPRVALLANGTEEHKGNKLTREAYTLIEQTELNFIGNREGRDILSGGYDVMVCDGMSGNIAIKSMEGAIKTMTTLLKRELTADFKTKIGAALVRGGIGRVKRALDYQEYGGAPLLGVNGVSIVCHGSSGEKALLSAIDQAVFCVKRDFAGELTRALQVKN